MKRFVSDIGWMGAVVLFQVLALMVAIGFYWSSGVQEKARTQAINSNRDERHHQTELLETGAQNSASNKANLLLICGALKVHCSP